MAGVTKEDEFINKNLEESHKIGEKKGRKNLEGFDAALNSQENIAISS